MEQKYKIKTKNRQMAYYRLGEGKPNKLILLHGNASSAAFFFPFIYRLAEHFDVVAPDLNGFGDTEASPIKAPTALADWADDVQALAGALDFSRFALLGWSLGGGVAWQAAIRYPQAISHLLLLSPMSPYGFGGTKGVDGQMYDPPGWGSPGGFANTAFLQKLAEQHTGDDPMGPRAVLEKSLFAKGWPVEKEWQDLFVAELLKIRLGEDYYPGNYQQIPAFPYVLPGDKGISNSLAPQYAKVTGILDIQPKPPILWIRGDQDQLVSDRSFSDLAVLGSLGLLPGYPGEEAFPPQPMVAQTRQVLEQYKEKGGTYKELVMDGCAHASHLEDPERFLAEVLDFLG